MNELLSLKEAKRLSIIKWTILSTDDGRTPAQLWHEMAQHPELMDLTNECGFCQRHDNKYGVSCTECELGKVMGGICTDSNSLYHKHSIYENRSPESAQRVLDAINSIPTDDEEDS